MKFSKHCSNEHWIFIKEFYISYHFQWQGCNCVELKSLNYNSKSEVLRTDIERIFKKVIKDSKYKQKFYKFYCSKVKVALC